MCLVMKVMIFFLLKRRRQRGENVQRVCLFCFDAKTNFRTLTGKYNLSHHAEIQGLWLKRYYYKVLFNTNDLITYIRQP